MNIMFIGKVRKKT